VGKPPEKLRSYHDDQAEHSRGGGHRCGVRMQRNGAHCMHEGQKIYIHGIEKRRVVVAVGVAVVAVEENLGVYKEAEHSSRKCIVEECCIERIWHREHKMEKKRKCKGCTEDTDVDREKQCNRTTTRLLSH
jgi:hypothetical protein